MEVSKQFTKYKLNSINKNGKVKYLEDDEEFKKTLALYNGKKKFKVIVVVYIPYPYYIK